ncbi:hypothetical protein TNCV_3757781 [Trichonephila clavipes]|nr:hypothetical protein TNCV_3757781 [Trichonephila clavipes]
MRPSALRGASSLPSPRHRLGHCRPSTSEIERGRTFQSCFEFSLLFLCGVGIWSRKWAGVVLPNALILKAWFVVLLVGQKAAVEEKGQDVPGTQMICNQKISAPTIASIQYLPPSRHSAIKRNHKEICEEPTSAKTLTPDPTYICGDIFSDEYCLSADDHRTRV